MVRGTSPKPALPGLGRNNSAEPPTMSNKFNKAPALPGLRRNKSVEPRLGMAGTAGLQRNNSIDPKNLGQTPRRIRNRPQPHQVPDDSCGFTVNSAGSGETEYTNASFASKWSYNGGESIKFGVKNFVNQKEGTLESVYDVGNLVGEGGFGEVYSCYHLETGEERAVKVMEKSAKKKHINEEIVKEYNILKELDHPNILKVYEMYETKNHFFIVTDLYSGGDLFSELEGNGCFKEKEAAQLLNSMLMCMNYCHKRNLVHLDLKPENILLTETKSYSDVKIIDFGLAQYQTDNKKMTGLEGSSYYMSPQVVKRSYIGSKADVWSCGVICHVMMTGYAPFDGPNYQDILDSITLGVFDFDEPEWDGVSNTCKDFIAYCLTYKEDKRPSAEEALTHPFLKKCRRQSEKADKNRHGSLQQSLENLEQFSSRHSKLKQATCAIMASQLLSQEEKDEIDDIFRHLDTDHDGALDRDDLKRGYKQYFERELSDSELDNVVEQVNFSGSGKIEYSEFAIAILMAQDKVGETKLKAAFNVFDDDGKGHMSAEDIKRVLKLGDDQDDYLKKKILREVDAEKTEKIDFEQFTIIMHSTTSLRKRKKKKKKMPLKRNPRRGFVSALAGLEIKDFQDACVLDTMDGDASELSNSGRLPSHGGHERRGVRSAAAYAPLAEGSMLHDLSEYDDEDESSQKDANQDADEEVELSQSEYEEEV